MRYWQAWVFLLVFGISVTLITAHFLRTDPALIERRLNVGATAEKEPTQKRIQAVSSVLFIALVAFPGFDHHFEWSKLPAYIALAGDTLVALGLFIVFLVFGKTASPRRLLK